jgi:predicted pyridoxine 5'-phosphate oxidase superfamily flavin-nucleotide-binding protein
MPGWRVPEPILEVVATADVLLLASLDATGMPGRRVPEPILEVVATADVLLLANLEATGMPGRRVLEQISEAVAIAGVLPLASLDATGMPGRRVPEQISEAVAIAGVLPLASLDATGMPGRRVPEPDLAATGRIGVHPLTSPAATGRMIDGRIANGGRPHPRKVQAGRESHASAIGRRSPADRDGKEIVASSGRTAVRAAVKVPLRLRTNKADSRARGRTVPGAKDFHAATPSRFVSSRPSLAIPPRPWNGCCPRPAWAHAHRLEPGSTSAALK